MATTQPAIDRRAGRLVFATVVALHCGLTLVGASPSQSIRSQPKDNLGRAAELRQRRQEKGQLLEPPTQGKFEKALVYIEEHGHILMPRWKDFYPRFGRVSRGSGFSLGARYFKQNLVARKLSFESSAAFSFTGYKVGSLQFGSFNQIAPYGLVDATDIGVPFEFGRERPDRSRLFLYGDVRYRYLPREDFYGVGPDSREDDRTSFLLEEGSYDLVAGFQNNRHFGVAIRAGILQTNTGEGTDNRFPDIREIFDNETAPGLDRQPAFFRVQAAVYLDFRDVPSNPHSGGFVAFAFSRFDDTDGQRFDFNRYNVDVRYFLKLGSRQRVLALRFFTSLSDSPTGREVPFFLMDTLGGSRTLRGYPEFRFRDANLVHLSAEYRWEAAPAIELALFYDAGKVFPETDDFSFKSLKKSAGGGVRFKMSDRVILRFDVGRSTEGTEFRLSYGRSF